ncbi:HNH endonuclease [Actinosynnema sp.]|uniref:HNH endonuclease n=1 Tax=Actinosynnema sp. TaxID=1872144 RepID=UPI003F833748
MYEKRDFRSAESLEAEEGRRDALVPFLAGHGFRVRANGDHRRTHGASAVEQLILAVSPQGEDMLMRVRLCWLRKGKSSNEHLFAAAQLSSKLRNESHAETLAHLRNRDARRGITHTLFVQDDRLRRIICAAVVPTDALGPIWEGQRAVAEELLRSPSARPNAANQILNGKSPTIYLMDERREDSYRIPAVLWNTPGVIRLGPAAVDVPVPGELASVDAVNDLAPNPDLLGRDGAEAVQRLASSYPRNPAVRRAVLRRADGRCERPGCGASRPWVGFLDVHHVLGVAESDRPRNCVALCPNCHREAHFSPGKDALNAELLSVAQTASRRADPISTSRVTGGAA